MWFSKNAHHAIDQFECGKDSLDRYLRESARRDRSFGIAVVYVLACGPTVIGYYTLHQHVIEAEQMPEKLGKRLSRYSVYPATLIGRLAIDRRYAGQGFGRDLMLDALTRALESASTVASVGVVVDALDEEAQKFYEHYGFILLGLPDKRRLFLGMKAVGQLLVEARSTL